MTPKELSTMMNVTNEPEHLNGGLQLINDMSGSTTWQCKVCGYRERYPHRPYVCHENHCKDKYGSRDVMRDSRTFVEEPSTRLSKDWYK